MVASPEAALHGRFLWFCRPSWRPSVPTPTPASPSRWLVPLTLLAAIAWCGGCRPLAPSATPRAGASPTGPYTTETLPAGAGFPLTVTDDVGATMTFARPPQRLVSLAPSLTELLFALGLGNRVVGVTDYCKYPPEALKKPRVGGYINSSLEKIVSLAPDAIFCTRGTPQTFMQSLRGSGLKVFAVDQTTLQQVVNSMIAVGQVCGRRQQAAGLAGRLTGLQSRLRQKTQGLRADQKPRVLFVVQVDPLFAAGTGSYQDDLLQDCGAVNIARTDKPFAPLSGEVVISADPQVLIMTSDQLGKLSREQMLAKLRTNSTYAHTSAVRTGRLIVLPVDHISIPGPRLVLGMRQLARELRPELLGNL